MPRDDLRRFIDGMPIRAKPAGVAQRVSKWAARHRSAVLATCVVLSLACACLAVSTVVVLREQAQTVRKLEENRQAFEEFGMRTAEWLKGATGTEHVRRALLAEVLASHQRVLAQVGDSPTMRADAALTLAKMASIHQDLGHHARSLETYRSGNFRTRRGFRLLLEPLEARSLLTALPGFVVFDNSPGDGFEARRGRAAA